MERNNPDDIHLRSEEVQEILGTPPGWMASWGTTLVFITFVVLAWAIYWIKFPDIVNAEIEITRRNPIITLTSQKANMVIDDIIVANNDSVGVGQLLMVFESYDNASYGDVLTLYDRIINLGSVSDSVLSTVNLPEDLQLGNQDLADAFYAFRESQINYSFAMEPAKPSDFRSQRDLAELRGNLVEQEKLKFTLATELDAANTDLLREKRRFEEGKIAFPILNNAENKVIRLEREMQGVISNIKNFNYYIKAIERQSKDERLSISQLRQNRLQEMRAKYDLLTKKIKDWCDTYMVTASISGRVQYSQENLRERMEITNANSPIFIIIPSDNSETVGKGYLRLEGSGKVRPNQEVIVKLNSYPFHEFGALVGEVTWKGRAPTEIELPDGRKERRIYYEVNFKNGLVTSYGELLDDTPNTLLIGEAEIITDNKSLIDWVIQGFSRPTIR